MRIAVDWGSTSFRAYLLDEHNNCVDKVKNASGVFNLKTSFVDTLKIACAEWMQSHEIKHIVMGGMVGSRNGWVETAYSQCPVSAVEHKNGAVDLDTEFDLQVQVLPGVQGQSPCGFPDVMRGEEIQLFGALEHLEKESAIVCLPGTHSKWVQLQDGKITEFATLMTGELFALLREHSSIASLVTDEEFDQASFLQGVEDQMQAEKTAACKVGLLHSLFSVRARAVSNTLHASSVFSYLSGLIIADEISTAGSLFDLNQEIVVITDEKLSAPYSHALNAATMKAVIIDSETAFLQGIKRLIQ